MISQDGQPEGQQTTFDGWVGFAGDAAAAEGGSAAVRAAQPYAPGQRCWWELAPPWGRATQRTDQRVRLLLERVHLRVGDTLARQPTCMHT